MSKAADELMARLEAEEKAHDAKMLAQGMRYKVDAWIHPKEGGDDRQVTLYTNLLPTWPDLGKRLRRSVIKHDWCLRSLDSDLKVWPLDASMRAYKATLEGDTYASTQPTIEEAVAAVQRLAKQGSSQEPASEPAKAYPEPPQAPSGEPTDPEDLPWSNCPDSEAVFEQEECYVVVCHDEAYDRVEIYAVIAEASRFARRAAQKLWKNDHGSAAGIEFNARYWGPNLSN